MRNSMTESKAFAVVLFMLTIPSLVRAESIRTWVSGVGDDANTCSRTAPCKTFAGAILQTSTGGEINAVTSGGFGGVTITKSVTIDGAGTQASIVASGITGISINITAAADGSKTVRLRNLSINGTGSGKTGLKVIAGRRVYVEHVLIDGFDDHGILVEAMVARLFVSDTTIRSIGKSGIHVSPLGNSPFVSVFVQRSSLIGTFHALNVNRGSRVTIRDSSLTGNRQGFLAAERSEVTATNCVLTEHSVAINSHSKSIIRLSLVTVVNNEEGLKVGDGGEIISFKNNVVHGNTVNGAATSTIAP